MQQEALIGILSKVPLSNWTSWQTPPSCQKNGNLRLHDLSPAHQGLWNHLVILQTLKINDSVLIVCSIWEKLILDKISHKNTLRLMAGLYSQWIRCPNLVFLSKLYLVFLRQQVCIRFWELTQSYGSFSFLPLRRCLLITAIAVSIQLSNHLFFIHPNLVVNELSSVVCVWFGKSETRGTFIERNQRIFAGYLFEICMIEIC